jgi:hypothetical protein
VRGMSSSDTTRCATCQQPATVRVRGVSLCAACALVAVSRPADGDDERAASRLARRLRRLGALSGMLTAKIVLGAVALAAVGSVAVASVGAGSTTTTTAPPTTSTQGQDEYRQAVRDWADCVSVAAAAADTDFDPIAACGEWPTPATSVAAGADVSTGDPSVASDDSTAEPPSQAETAPGLAETTPGQAETTPADGAEPPGLVEATPGQAETTPGQSGTNPGKSGAAPGHNKDEG